MNGWTELEDGSGYYTPIEPTATDVMAALARLPSMTIIETAGDCEEASGVWFYPEKGKALIL